MISYLASFKSYSKMLMTFTFIYRDDSPYLYPPYYVRVTINEQSIIEMYVPIL